MINNIRKNFTITPNELINDNRLSSQARFLFVYLCSKPEDWEFRNKKIEFDLNIGKDSRLKYINELKASGWLTVQQKRKDGGGFLSNEYILNSIATPVKTAAADISSHGKSTPPINQAADNNGSVKNPPLNNTDNNTNTNLFSNTENVVSLDLRVLNFLNEAKPSKKPFESVKSNLAPIKARIKEKNYTFNDFKKVIQYKVDQWKGETKTRVWIRPSTLFGQKFDSYLVEANDNFVEQGNDGSDNFEYKPQKSANLL